MTEPFADRVLRGAVLLGAVVHLPGDDAVTVAVEAGLDFIAVDLVDGPIDEVALRRLVRATGWTGLGTVALVKDAVDVARVVSSGIDGVVTPRDGRLRLGLHQTGPPLAVVGHADEVAGRVTSGAQLVALDVRRSLVALLRSFAASRSEVAGPEPLVLLPGMLGDARLFDDVVDVLARDGVCRPMRIDLDDSIVELAESVLAAAPPRFALAGHSLGGIVALEVWRRAPTRVTRLALLNTSARPPSAAQLAAWAELRDRTQAGGFSAIVTEQSRVNLGSSHAPELVERWVEMAEKVGPEGFLRQLRAQASRPDSGPSLPAITVPTLVLSGGDDTVCPPELQRELAGAIPGARHMTVEGAGHMSPLDRPREVAAQLHTWLTS